MASSHNTHSETAKMEQIITEFFSKSLHIILESRSPYVSSRNVIGEQATSSPSSFLPSSSSVRPRDKWFNLALRECPAALENIDLWRQNNLEPMVVDVVLVQRPLDWDQMNSPKRDLARNLSPKDRYQFRWNPDLEDIGSDGQSERIVERWIVQYESRKCKDTNSGNGNRRSQNITLHTLYKKSILLLRTLYSTVRLLPAYKIFRDLHSSCHIQPFTLTHRLSAFVEPFNRREGAEMQQFGFTPVDTSSGRLCISVLYRSSLSDISAEPSTPMSPQVIQDYVGSPLADPLKRFPNLPMSGVSPHGSPSSLPYSRHHSWSYDRYGASLPSLSFSPSSIHSESHALVTNPALRRLPPSSLPPHPPESGFFPKKNMSGDEYYPSPTFSPSMSPSLSPPIYIPGRHVANTVFRSESAPANVPAAAKLPNFPALSNKPNLPPSPPFKVSGFGPSRTNRDIGSFQTGSAVEKSFSLGRDERKYSGWKVSSNCSPQISLSRSSSRSFQDDFDDSEFPCPFDVDDDDMTDPGSRPESFDQKGNICELLEPGGLLFPIKKSQDAAVGALVQMLRKAPPLRQDLSNSFNISPASRPGSWSNKTFKDADQNPETVSSKGYFGNSTSIASSGLIAAKTTADALEELHSYREMKNLLLKQGNVSQLQDM